MGTTLPLALELFGKSQPGRFFAGSTLALDIGGSTAWMAGHANPEELAGFLCFCGCRAVILDEAEAAPPAGWTRARTHGIFGLTPGRQLPQPHADETLWASLRLEREPPAYPVAEELFPDRPARRDDFYSELCSKRSRGKARVWALMQGERSLAPWGPMPLRTGRPTWPVGRRQRNCAEKASAGGSSSNWRTSFPPRACSPSSCAARSVCTFIPASASKNSENMHGMSKQKIEIG